MIDVKNLSKHFKVYKRKSGAFGAVRSLVKPEYEYIHALDDVSFSIGKGEIVGYIGPNGAGKSTTVKVLSGILVPDGGEVIVNGLVPWKDRKSHVANIGVVFGQRSQLWWDVPVHDSYELLRDIYRIPADRYAENVSVLTELLDLEKLLPVPVRQLSLGQRMRCEIAASLLHDPGILFLDEPTIGLDAVSKLAVRKFIREINKERNVTVILTTHDTGDIEALADRILLIGKGKILYDGRFNELKKKFHASRTLKIHFTGEAREIPSVTGILKSNIHENEAEVVFDPENISVSALITYISGILQITDLEIETVEAEEIIAGLYREFEI
ncbi:MAG TPA: ABC transporter ATP-binding protein [Clostridia bacterium]|nr:ABC transporter ATP-binding protein [Clostridia bacterium]